ncbi:secretion system X translation initiation factor [Dechloromonas sp. A34]|uniref:secretion system X translation initiation factor n=1 Tax=Dechloromonas sp. A34 TaxID=447588 RepID=UPI002B05956C|nr:secretion system X translation initiation factor [Dechloromonas sp. A34]
MKLSAIRLRQLILGSLLLGTLGAAALVDDAPLEPARPAGAKTAVAAPTVTDAAATVLPARALAAPREGIADAPPDSPDPFRSRSWYVPPPPPPPAKPSAPPLPFEYLGQLVEADERRVFLKHQGQNRIIRVGDVIAGTYAVEACDAGQVVFIYLPLKERQVLATGPG